MAGIQDTDVIDVVAQDADGECMLVMIEERAWGSDPDQPIQLREKINTYVGYALDGSLAHNYPETTGHPIRLQIDCAEPLTDDIAAIVDHAAGKLAELGMRIVVNARG